MSRIIFLLVILMYCETTPSNQTSSNPSSSQLLLIPEGFSKISNKENEEIYKKYDEFENITFYMHSHFFENRNIEIYVTETKEEKLMRIIFFYNGDSWLHLKYAILLNSNGEKIRFNFSFSEVNSTIEKDGVKEDIDTTITEKEGKNILKLLKLNNGIKLRLSGDKYYRDYDLSEPDVKALKSMINFYFEKKK